MRKRRVKLVLDENVEVTRTTIIAVETTVPFT